MEDCESPLYNVVFVITEHSGNLYKTIYNLKRILSSTDQQANDNGGMDIPFNNDDNLCWCSHGKEQLANLA